MLQNVRVAVIGMGKMGVTIAKALVQNQLVPPERVVGTTAHDKSAQRAHTETNVRVTTSNETAVANADIVILAVKPQTMFKLLQLLAPHMRSDQLVISLAAATAISKIENLLKEGIPVIRAMPNLPALVKQGMTVLCPGSHVQEMHIAQASAIFGAFGLVEVIDNEDHMDAVTALAGSGPAYGYIIIESLAEGGVKTGLPRSLATILAAQAMKGAASMVLETGEHPAKLKDMVTTPAGTTVDGIMALEEGSLRVALIKAVDAATAKSKEISKS